MSDRRREATNSNQSQTYGKDHDAIAQNYLPERCRYHKVGRNSRKIVRRELKTVQTILLC